MLTTTKAGSNTEKQTTFSVGFIIIQRHCRSRLDYKAVNRDTNTPEPSLSSWANREVSHQHAALQIYLLGRKQYI